MPQSERNIRTEKKEPREKAIILEELKKRGLRITNQRILLLDIILENRCSCCKEIYYRAHRRDSSIGIATVYRMVKVLEEMGAIDRSSQYRIFCEELCDKAPDKVVHCTNQRKISLSSAEWKEVICAGLAAKGYIGEEDIEKIAEYCPDGQKGVCGA